MIDTVHPRTARPDGRASAIAATSFQMLRTLGVAQNLNDEVEPILDILISDGGVGDVSPLGLHMDSQNVSGPTAYMIENDVLRAALFSAVETQSKIDIFAPTEMISSQRDSAGVSVSLSDGQRFTSSCLLYTSPSPRDRG